MASVFLSYDHEDAACAAPLAAALEAEGHSVWWDQQLHGGAEFNDEIEAAVARSDAIVVLWSNASIRSAWVRDEAAEGRDAGKLVPVLIEAVKPPMGFRQYQAIDLSSWNRGKRIPQLPQLLRAINKLAKVAPAVPPDAPIPISAATSPFPAPASTLAPALARGHVVTPKADQGIARRMLIGGGLTVGATVIGGGWYWAAQARTDPRFEALMQTGRTALRARSLDDRSVGAVQQAVSLQPRNAEAWGLLALIKSFMAARAAPADVVQVTDQAEQAARRAFALNPAEPNALLAMFELQGSTLDWLTRDRKLRQIIAVDRDNIIAISELVVLLQAVGLVRESYDWNERALALEPLSIEFLGRRALKLWGMGRVSEGDKVIDRARVLAPNAQWPWWVRFFMYAFTGRAGAARAMLEANPTMNGDPSRSAVWRASLPALEKPSPGAVAEARTACVAAARLEMVSAVESGSIMSALGEVETALDIAEGALLSRGPIVHRDRPGSSGEDDASWRISTQWLFTPPLAALRADPRFLTLCEGIGIAEYWRKRGVKPDYLTARA